MAFFLSGIAPLTAAVSQFLYLVFAHICVIKCNFLTLSAVVLPPPWALDMPLLQSANTDFDREIAIDALLFPVLYVYGISYLPLQPLMEY